MSNHLAIATVTAAIRQLLHDVVNADVSATVSILPPDDPALKNDAARLNLFLYQVSPSAAWRNADIPGRRPDGSLASRPQLGLDLHYLLTAYGKATEDDPQVHRILGSAVRTLHERPVLTREALRSIGNTHSTLADSDLADQVEMVKVTLQPLPLEELSKLWSVFFQTPYRPSVAYTASVVLIEGRESPKPALPVREPRFHLLPLNRPVIDRVSPQSAVYGEHLVLSGRNLKADRTEVAFGEQIVAPDPDLLANDQLSILPPPGLPAGVNTLRIVHELDFATREEPHRGFESNTVAFVLRPRIVDKPTFAEEEIVEEEGVSVKSGTVAVTVRPAVGERQKAKLLLDRMATPAGRRPGGFSFGAPVPDRWETDVDARTTTIPFPVRLKEEDWGDYLVRVQVDGADSPLEDDADPKNPTYIRPTVTL